jgi:hypothetical protein
MDRYLVCDNPQCRHLLDRKINGEYFGEPQLFVKKCPSCGGNWSTVCPSCHQSLAVKSVGGLPHIACCQTPHRNARAAAA